LKRGTAIASLLFAWLCANGALWDAAQIFAWGRMVVEYSRIMPLSTALEKTFDGSASCEICAVVDNARAQQTPQATERDKQRILLACELPAPIFVAAPKSAWTRPGESVRLMVSFPVELQPPRV